MGLFGPTRQERHAAAATALAPYGFRLDPQRANNVLSYTPFAAIVAPSTCHMAVFGQIESARVEAYEYTYQSTDAEGGVTYADEFVVVVQHPWIVGGATFAPDLRAWGGVYSVIDALLWIPPFTLVKLVQLFGDKEPDRVVGHGEFDRLYKVRAASDDDAARAIPQGLRELFVRAQLRATVELRPGVLLYSLFDHRLDDKTAVAAVGFAGAIIAALEPTSEHPMR